MRAKPVVLLVDDEPDILISVLRALRRSPWDIRTCDDPRLALDIARESNAQVVVSDLMMPILSGIELLKLIRDELPDTKRVMLTGSRDVQAAAAAINDAGVHRFLLKPVEGEALRGCIEELLAPHEDTDDVAAQHRDPRAFEETIEQLWLSFQPIFDARTLEVFSHEVLCRSRCEGFSTPIELFRTARELGSIPRLERRIHELVAERMATSPDDACFFVNVDPTSLANPDVLGPSCLLLPYSERIVLEVTEHVALSRLGETGEIADDLRRHKYRIAVDDLGSGFSSLTNLTRLEPDVVKYDGELFRDIGSSPIKPSLVRSLNALCRELGIRTVAEGIETAEQLALAVELGCDLVQGFYLARPAPGLFRR